MKNNMYMHEYGHTFDSRLFGFSYLLAIGLPSIISAAGDGNHSVFWTEIRANNHAKNYFEKHYNIEWNFSRYPLKRRMLNPTFINQYYNRANKQFTNEKYL